MFSIKVSEASEARNQVENKSGKIAMIKFKCDFKNAIALLRHVYHQKSSYLNSSWTPLTRLLVLKINFDLDVRGL